MATSSSERPQSSLDVGVDLPIRRLYLPKEEGLLVARAIDSESRL
jgi:hypothetical protein